MEINILSTRNGVGLEKDANRLISILKEDGHNCHFVDVGKGDSPKKADVNIFCEHFHKANFTRMAKRNYLFPNPEWFQPTWLRNLSYLTGVLCKTHDCKEIFSKYTSEVHYTGFTSVDLLDQKITKNNTFFHSAGKSSHKGTEQILSAWNNNFLPHLTITHTMNKRLEIKGNIAYNYKYFDSKEYSNLLNSFRFHLCPSHYEGWGHYIHEAKSTGAIVITTNSAPMNEFVNKEFGYLCEVSETRRKDLADLKIISAQSLINAVEKCSQLTQEEIEKMSIESRNSYLSQEISFKENFLKIINQ